MNVLGIIPSRYASTRFPGKPLTIIHGKSMIQRVFEQALKASLVMDVVVATDDDRIKNEVEGFGGKVIMTSDQHSSGTDRCQEVVEKFEKAGVHYNVVVNIQGDEPYINPLQIDEVVSCFENQDVQIATLIKKISTLQELLSPNVNKVVFNHRNEAIYFSRHPIPYFQNLDQTQWLSNHIYFKHIGIYGYRTDILKEITQLEKSKLEIAESLEQLRWLNNGYRINVLITELESFSVDTPDDLSKFLNKS
ncbi:MAG: 3-deoxy-manno-octulosonate cytidylyltransferase [Bacteroidales bacterium]